MHTNDDNIDDDDDDVIGDNDDNDFIRRFILYNIYIIS